MTEPTSRSRWARFTSELRRRRVIRTAGVYAAAAFVVLQAADLAVEPLELPGWTMKLLWVLALGGLPVVVALAWVFDVVPDGAAPDPEGSPDLRSGPVDDEGSKPTSRARTRSGGRRVLVGVAASAVIIAGIVAGRGVLLPTPDEVAISSVAVFPFHVRGSAALGYLREGMVDLLSRNLDGAGGLRSVDPVRVIELAAAEGGEAFGAESGGELARRIGAGQYVVGSVNAVAGKVRIHASLYALGDSIRALSVTEVEGDTTELFTLVDRLTAELLAGQPLGPASQSLARGAAVTSRSLPALKAYLEGERLLRDADFDEANAKFAEAVEHDSAFALAHYRKAVAHRFAYQFTEAREAAARALENADGLGRHDRLLAEAFGRMMTGDMPGARDRYRAILREYPDDLEAKVHLGGLLEFLNPLEGNPVTEARELLEEVLEVDPQFNCTLCSLMRLAGQDGDWTAWERYSRRVAANESGDSALDLGQQLVLAVARGEERALDSLLTVADTITDEHQGHSLHYAAHSMFGVLYRPDLGHRLHELSLPPDVAPADSELLGTGQALGRWGRVHQMVEEAWSTGALEPDREPHLMEAVLHFDPEAALPEPLLVEARRRVGEWTPGSAAESGDSASSAAAPPAYVARYYAGLAASRLGDRAAALAAAHALESVGDEESDDRSIAGVLAAVLRAEVAYRAGESAGILSAVEGMELRVPYDRWTWLFIPHVYGVALRVEALLALERYQEAVRWLEHSFIGSVDGYYAFRQHRLARAHDALGNREQAATAYARFLAAREDADPELQPGIEHARARLARLTAEPAG